MAMLPLSIMPPGYIPVAHAVVAFDPAAVPRVEDPPLTFQPPPPASTAVAAATPTAVKVSTAVGAKRAARALTALSGAKVRDVRKPKSKKARPHRPNQTGRTLVPTEDRTDNQLTKLIRHISGTGNGKYDARDVGTRMTTLSDVLGLVNITEMAMLGKPQLLAAYHIVLDKASAVAQERRLFGKTRSTYTDAFKDAVKLLITDEGVAFLQNALSASV